MKKIVSFILIAAAILSLSGCGAQETGTQRISISDFTSYHKGSLMSFMLYEDYNKNSKRYARIDTSDYSYSLPYDNIEYDYDAWTSMLFCGAWTEYDDFYYYDDFGELIENKAASVIEEYIDGATSVNTACFYMDDGLNYAFVNFYTHSSGVNKNKLYIENIDYSAYITVDTENGTWRELKLFDGYAILACNENYVVYERDYAFYSYCVATGEEKYLFDDDAHDMILQHGNKLNLRFNGYNLIFESVQARLGGNYASYTLVSMDGSVILKLYEGKR